MLSRAPATAGSAARCRPGCLWSSMPISRPPCATDWWEEIASIPSSDLAVSWARGARRQEQSHCSRCEARRGSFEERLSQLASSEIAMSCDGGDSPPADSRKNAHELVASRNRRRSLPKVLTRANSRSLHRAATAIGTISDTSQQPCLICGRKPSDPHHLRFAQPRALGRKASDEFTVPLCRIHHRLAHRRRQRRRLVAGGRDRSHQRSAQALAPHAPAQAEGANEPIGSTALEGPSASGRKDVGAPPAVGTL